MEIRKTIFGNMILRPIPGRKKPILEERQDKVQPGLISGPKGISGPVGMEI